MESKSKKLPSVEKCLEYAEHVAEDLKPLGSWETEKIDTYWFKERQLRELIDFCQGVEIQNDLFNPIEK